MSVFSPVRYVSGSLIAIFLLLSSSCSMAPNQSATPLATLGETNRCSAGASLVNPHRNLGAENSDATTVEAKTNGVGGDGRIALRPGIGGTGQREALSTGGIGGTGIVGVVTGFASICVNGAEVHYTESTPVFIDGEAASPEDLVVGQIVAVRANGSARSPGAQLTARQIAVQHAVVGPLTRLNIATGEFSVMGQDAVAMRKNELARLKPGDWVEVSGFRVSSGVIRASHVNALLHHRSTAQLRGQIMAIDGHVIQVGTTPVILNELPIGFKLRREISVRGHWNGRQLEATDSTIDPTRTEIGSVSELLLQGYVQDLKGNDFVLNYGSFRFSSQAHISSGNVDALKVGQQIQVHGFVSTDGTMVADQLNMIDGPGSPDEEEGSSSNGTGKAAAQGGHQNTAASPNGQNGSATGGSSQR